MTALTLEALRGFAQRVKLPAERFAHCISALCVVAAVSGYGQRTVEYLPVWKNSLSLWTYATQKTPTLAVTWIQLALTHHALGHTDKAVATLHTAMGTCRMDVHDEKRVTEMLHKWTDHAEQSIPGTDKPDWNVDAALRTGMLPPASH
jgi:hypothetical protein